MKRFFTDKRTRENCAIYKMLVERKRDKHLSFHTPGHKIKGWDITELSYSDNLSDPTGCILFAERDIAEILGANKSFILTDGSTSGVLAMVYAAKLFGASQEVFMLGSERAIISIANNKKATLSVDNELIKEI